MVTVWSALEGQGRPQRDRCARAEWRVVCAGFPTTRGRSQHERLVHPEWYHGIRISLVSKSGWTDEEMVRVAREENRLVEVGRHLCGNPAANIRVNQDLLRKSPKSSADAIHGLRKTANYRTMRDRLSVGVSAVEDPIDYERPWEARLGTVQGGLPSPPTQEEMKDSARRRPSPWRTPEPKDRTGPKLRWTAGEMEAVAEAEDRLRATKSRNINKDLHMEFPDRTLEAIKGMRRLPKYRALLGRSRVRGAVAPVEIPPSTEAERGASPLTENVESPPPSPGSPEMFTRTDTIRTPETTRDTTIRTRSEDM